MAEQKITFTIGSIFKGEGFKQVQNGIKDLNGHIKKAQGTVAQMASVIGTMDSKAGQAASAVSGLLASFATGNPILIAVQVSMLAVNQVLGMIKKAEDEAKEAADKLKESLKQLHDTQERLASEKLASRISDIKNEAKRLGDEFDRITKSANAFKLALQGVEGSKDKGKILSLQLQKLQDTSSGNTDDKAVKEAEWNYKIQLERNVQALKSKADILESAKEAEKTNLEREKNIRERNLIILGEIADLQKEMSKVQGGDLKKRKAIQSKIKELEDERAKLTKEFIDAQSQEKILKQKVIQAEQDYSNQQIENQIAITKSNQAIIEAETARAELIRKRNNDESELHKKQIEVEEKLLDAANEKLTKAKSEKTKAQQNLNKKADDYVNDNKNLLNNIIRGLDQNQLYRGNLQSLDVQYMDKDGNVQVGNYQDVAAKAAIEKGIIDGTIRNSRQLHDVERQARRAARDAASSRDTNQERRDARELDRLSNMNPKAMSPADRKKLENLQALQDRKDRAEWEAKEAADMKKEADEAVKEIESTVKEIKEKLEQLGLK